MRWCTILLLACTLPALEVAEIRHLLGRAGMGATGEDFIAYAPLTWPEAVDRLLAWSDGGDAPVPAWADEPPTPPRVMKELDEAGRKALRELNRQRGEELQARWMDELISARDPLRERLVLIWHGHFTSSLQKVHRPGALLHQHRLLRRLALGDFRELAHAIARDPAMIHYLDNQTNRKGHPNENFARELFELFLLGEGRYGEHDITEAARAFAGWHIDPDTGGFRLAAWDQDDGAKTVFGTTGNLGGDQVVDLCLARPECAAWVVERLWRELVDPQPDPAEVGRIAAILRRDWQLRPALRALLLSPRFRAAGTQGALVKGPIDLVAATCRLLAWRPADLQELVRLCRDLGQEPFNPPNVKGWPGGPRWITAGTLLRRRQALEQALRHLDDGDGPAMRPAPAASTAASPPRPRLDLLVADRLPESVLAVAAAVPSRATTPGGRLRAAILDPAYQVK